jgi:hypothetical protein
MSETASLNPPTVARSENTPTIATPHDRAILVTPAECGIAESSRKVTAEAAMIDPSMKVNGCGTVTAHRTINAMSAAAITCPMFSIHRIRPGRDPAEASCSKP